MMRTPDDGKLLLAVVLHERTDLPPGLDPPQTAEAIVRNARMRSEGGTHRSRRLGNPAGGGAGEAWPPQHRAPGPQVDTGKAQTKLDWSADWRIS
jgi:hypothetical protein